MKGHGERALSAGRRPAHRSRRSTTRTALPPLTLRTPPRSRVRRESVGRPVRVAGLASRRSTSRGRRRSSPSRSDPPSSTARTCRCRPTPTRGRAVRAAGRCAHDVLVAPAVPYGSSGEHAGFAGTLSIGQDALEFLVRRIGPFGHRTFDSRRPRVGTRRERRAGRRAVARLRAEWRDVCCSRRVGRRPACRAHRDVAATRAAPGRRRRGPRARGDTRPLTELLPLLRDGGVRSVRANGVLGDPTGAHGRGGPRRCSRRSPSIWIRASTTVARETAWPAHRHRAPRAVSVPPRSRAGCRRVVGPRRRRARPTIRRAVSPCNQRGSRSRRRRVRTATGRGRCPRRGRARRRCGRGRVAMGRSRCGDRCAGVIAGGVPQWEVPAQQEQAVLDVNLGGMLNLARVAFPALLRRPAPRSGRFLAVASAAATRGLPMLAAYCAAKAGVAARPALAVELAGTGVTANAVSPGSTATPILDESARLYGLAATGLSRRSSRWDDCSTRPRSRQCSHSSPDRAAGHHRRRRPRGRRTGAMSDCHRFRTDSGSPSTPTRSRSTPACGSADRRPGCCG